MIDRDLAELYGVETKRLKEAVRRNINRFPPDFFFEMDKEEFEDWRRKMRPPKRTNKVCDMPLFALQSKELRCYPAF